MLSKAQVKYIRSLTQQKFRHEHKAFVAEGSKIVGEWLQADGNIQMIIATPEWAGEHKSWIVRHPEAELQIAKEFELEAISGLQTPSPVLIVVPIAEKKEPGAARGWSLALDTIQDPGNLGTIVRVADWFGITDVACSPGCADIYNPKVVQSAMGGHLRVNIYETSLVPFLQAAAVPRYAATLDGESAYRIPRAAEGILIIGNESRGISPDVLEVVNRRVTIPRRGGAESLNAAVSAGILCSMLLPC